MRNYFTDIKKEIFFHTLLLLQFWTSKFKMCNAVVMFPSFSPLIALILSSCLIQNSFTSYSKIILKVIGNRHSATGIYTDVY